MQNQQNYTQIQQFRTVVTGYRLHGELLNIHIDEEIFSLKIQSSSNKQETYQITFDNQTLSFYKLNESFSTAKTLYDHLSKMTKMKIKFNNEAKILIILHEKQKILNEFPIELLSIKQRQSEFDKKEIETTFSQDKQQNFDECLQEQSNQKVQQLNNQGQRKIEQQSLTELNDKTQESEQVQTTLQSQQVKVQVQTQEAINVEDKIEQLRRYFEQMKSKEQQTKPVRQVKPIQYNFKKSESQAHNLYEYALAYKAQPLADLIESEQLDKVEEILIKRSRLPEVPPFSQITLSNLKFLSLQQNKLTKIQNIESMLNLQKLNLDGNKISKIQNLSHLVNLKILKLGNNDIQKIEGLDNLKNLQTLWLDFNSIQKIQGLNGLTKLKALNISFNLVKKIQNLDSLSNLEELLLNQNQITQIQNLDKLQKLIKLSISMNSIQKVRGLKKLLLLEVVYLNQNQIDEFDRVAFEELNWLKMLKEFKLNNNFIEWSEQSKGFIERLRNYGVKVSI